MFLHSFAAFAPEGFDFTANPAQKCLTAKVAKDSAKAANKTRSYVCHLAFQFGGLTLLSSSLYTQTCSPYRSVPHGTLRAAKVRKANVSPTETTSNTRREIAVEIPVEEVNRETASLIQKYQKLARIPGFRRGHVPASVIKQRFSEDLKSDVVEALVPRYFRKEADKQGLIPVSQPQVTDLQLKDNEPLRFKASFEVMPEIKVEGYKELRAEKPDITVTDEEVEQSLTSVREQ